MEFADKLRRMRKEAKLRQGELAEAAGLTTNKVQRYEQRGQKPKGEDALALARHLGVTVDYLLDDALPYPPPQEHLSRKVAIIHQLEGLIGALQSRREGEAPAPDDRPDVIHLPVYKLGAGFDVIFDSAGTAQGEQAGDVYFSGLGEGRYFAAELLGSSMQEPKGGGFSPGEILVFRTAEPGEVAPGDYVYVRIGSAAGGPGGAGLFRQAFDHGDRLRLRALNPADPELLVGRDEIAYIGRLVRRVKEY